ncbi:TorF family putative porin [Amphritea atlantica]|uniref:TorF family putative porin n=1 Tax=Amphritea atlantica TaxID=355243 RepID=A0ABY5GV24_9GAMM|nr:TorF family putative porin [Amphritea atlantica]
MKKLTKTLIASALLSASVSSFAGVSANVGAMSDYWFRGLDQSGDGGNASMMAGLDYESDMGFYAGTWLASLPSDLEYDLYAGYSGAYEDFSYGVGVIAYLYDKYEGDYVEYNLSAGYGPVSVSYNIGTLDEPGAPDVDYTFASITGEYEGAYLTYGVYGDDVDGSYFEAGYGMTYEGLDMSVAAIFPDDDNSANAWVSDTDKLTFTISKSFDLL